MMHRTNIRNGLENWLRFLKKNGSVTLLKSITELKEDFEDQLMIMVSGEFNAGKSTFINAILGDTYLTSAITPETAMITKLKYGEKKKIIAHYNNGSKKEYDISWVGNLTAEREGQSVKIRQQLAYVEYQLPIEFLKKYTLIDSPGLTALHKHHTEVTENFMARNDAAIWLFSSMNVGTASELEWLKKINTFGVPVYGIVNAIDRLDPEEDIESFLEYNERRLAPYIDKLHGISASEILQGKLEGKPELLEWGNAAAIDTVLKNIGPVENKKMESFFRKLQVPLTEYKKSIEKSKEVISFSDKTMTMKHFSTVSYPNIQQHSELYSQQVKNYETLINEWEQLSSEDDSSFDHVRRVLKKLNHNKGLTKEWNDKLSVNITAWSTQGKKMKEEHDEILKEQKALEDKWIKLKGKNMKLRNKVQFAYEEIALDEKIKEWNNKAFSFNKTSKNLREEIRRFDKRVIQELQSFLSSYRSQIDLAKKKLDDNVREVKERIGTLKITDINMMKDHIAANEKFSKEILSYFKVEASSIRRSRNYKKSLILMKEIETAYNEVDYQKAFKCLEEIYFSKTALKTFDIPSFNTVAYKVCNPGYLNEIPRNLKIGRKQAAVNEEKLKSRGIKLSVAIILSLLLIPYSINYFSSDVENDFSSDYKEPYYQEEHVDDIVPVEIEEEVEAVNDESDNESNVTSIEDEEEFISIDESKIEVFFQEYRSVYMQELNNGEVNNLDLYIDSEKEVYRILVDFINQNYEIQETYEFEDNEVLTIEQVDVDEYLITVHETFYVFKNDGSEIFNERNKIYTFKTNYYNDLRIVGYETIDQKSEVLVEPTLVPEEESVTSDLVSLEDVAQMMRDYYWDLEIAFNGAGFDYIEDYFVKGGKDFEPTETYINKALNENMNMFNHELNVELVEAVDANYYIATIYFKDEYNYQSGTGDIKEASAKYLIEVSPEGVMQIEELLELDILNEVEF